jgi:hypothetical protein
MYAAGLLLASQGMQRLGSLRANYYLGQVRARAVSPVRYGAQLPALDALAAPAAGGVRIIVRADSAGSGAASLCALASALARDPGVTWIARSAEPEPCTPRGAGAAPIRAGAAAAGELARARWILLGPSGHVLHSGWDVPQAGIVRETAALFAPPTGPGAP